MAPAHGDLSGHDNRKNNKQKQLSDSAKTAWVLDMDEMCRILPEIRKHEIFKYVHNYILKLSRKALRLKMNIQRVLWA